MSSYQDSINQNYYNFSGNINGSEPKSMICKISGNTKREVKFIWRLFFYSQYKAQFDELMSRIESNFFKDIIPIMQDTDYRSPKIYFNGKLLEKNFKKTGFTEVNRGKTRF